MSLWSRARPDAVDDKRSARAAASVAAIAMASMHQCDPETLLARLHRLIEDARKAAAGHEAKSDGFAVFVIELRRSDRTSALAGLEPAKAALAAVCQRICGMLRPRDRFALVGVDEILLLLPEVDSPGRALLVASRLVQELQQPLTDRAIGVRMRPSIGCALFPTHGEVAEELIDAADRASRSARTIDECYRIAERGERAVESAQLSNDLETALRANQLEVWLQPQFNLRTGLFDAAEALIRWPRPENVPPVSPIAAVAIAEANGLMPELTVFVLNTVLRQSALFARRGIELRIAINVSASMLSDSNLPMTIGHALELWGVPPQRLTLEVTENTLMQDVERSISILHELKRLGTHLSLDDFGTGYSSFAYLRRMPLDELKIDQLFVRSLNELPDGSVNPLREGDLRIVRSIVDIAHNFDLQTVAEGVEDETTMELLKSLGCDVIQGFFTGRPMRIPVFESWWAERHAAR